MIGIVDILLIAVVAGAVGSVLGLGGALILTPVLVYFGFPIKDAIAASMVAIVATSSGAASSYVKDGLPNMRAAFFLEGFTATGAIVGALVTSFIAPVYLFFFFAIFLATSFYGIRLNNGAGGVGMKPDPLAESLNLKGSYFDRPTGREVEYSLRRPLLASPGMLVAGLAAGMLGIGGGAFKTAIQELVMGMPSKVATATSNFMMGMTALAGASIYFAAGLVHLDLAAPLAIGTTVGSIMGSRLLPRLTNSAVRGAFMVVLAVLIAEMLYEGVAML